MALLITGCRVNVTLEGTGTGTVTSNPPGITCTAAGGNCSYTWAEGEIISGTLTATPDTGSRFSHWQCPNGTAVGNTCSRDNMRWDDGNVGDVRAHFTLQWAVNLAIGGEGSGSVTSNVGGLDCSGNCVVGFAENSALTLTADPDTGSKFAGWTGACTGTGACEVTTVGIEAVTATFDVLPTFDLGATLAGLGTGAVNSDPAGLTCEGAACSGTFHEGTQVTLTATADGDSEFAGWSGAGCSGTGTCVVPMTQARDVTATFALAPVFHDLSIGIGGHGSGSVTSAPDGVDCDGTDECVVQFTEGTDVTLTATPAHGSTFAGWTGGGCTGTGNCAVTVSEALQVLATFELIPAVHEPAPVQTTPPACGEGANSITCGVRTGENQTITLGGDTPATRITVELEGANGAGNVTARTITGDTRDGVLGDIVELNAIGFTFSRAKVCLPGPDPALLEELQLRLSDLQVMHDHDGDQNRMRPMAPDASGRVCVTVGEFSKFWVTHPERTVRSTDGGAAAAAASWAIRQHATGAKTVYLASSAQTVDALLAASGLSDSGIPLLLTDAGTLPAATRKALKALRPDRVVAFGGSSSLSDAVLAEAAALTGATVSRVAGENRHATAAAVSRLGYAGTATHVYLVNGDTGADLPGAAAAAAHKKAAVLLTSADALPAATAQRLAQLMPGRVTVVGGRAAVSDAVLDAVRRLTGAEVDRVSGPTRDATASALTRQTYRGDQAVAYVTDGADAGAVAATVAAAAAQGSAFVVTQPGGSTRALDRLDSSHVIQFGAGPV